MEVSNICIQYLKKNIRISIFKSLSELCPSRRIQCASGESSQPARKIPPASSFLHARGNPLLPARPRRPRRSSAACAVVVEVLRRPRLSGCFCRRGPLPSASPALRLRLPPRRRRRPPPHRPDVSSLALELLWTSFSGCGLAGLLFRVLCSFSSSSLASNTTDGAQFNFSAVLGAGPLMRDLRFSASVIANLGASNFYPCIL